MARGFCNKVTVFSIASVLSLLLSGTGHEALAGQGIAPDSATGPSTQSTLAAELSSLVAEWNAMVADWSAWTAQWSKLTGRSIHYQEKKGPHGRGDAFPGPGAERRGQAR